MVLFNLIDRININRICTLCMAEKMQKMSPLKRYRYPFWFGLLFMAFYLIKPLYPGEFSMGKVIAYPNPFSPETEKLTIKPATSAVFSGSVEYKIYDFNERLVYSGQTSNSAIYWSGHKSDGSRALPGLYFVKIIQTRSDYSTAVAIIKLLIK